jgi:hypothetical protein
MPLKALGDTQLTGRALASGNQTGACNWLAPLSQPPAIDYTLKRWGAPTFN